MTRSLMTVICVVCMLCSLMHLRCANGSISDSGSGSTTTNGIVSAPYVDSDGNPVSNVQVMVIPAAYDPVWDPPLSDSLVDTTDSNGICFFNVFLKGTYNILARDLGGEGQCLKTGIVFTADTVALEPDTLRKSGAVAITLPDSTDTLNCYVYVPGTIYYEKPSEEPMSMEHGYLHMVFDGLPAGTIPGIYYRQGAVISLWDSITINEDDTTDLRLQEEWTQYTVNNSGIPENEVTKVFVDASGLVWVGTQNSGLATFDGSIWTVYNIGNSDLPHNTVQGIAQAPDGSVWISTGFGAVRIENDTWEVFTILNSTIPETNINDIAFDSTGVVWFGAQQGCIHYDGEFWGKITAAEIFPMNYVKAVEVDRDGLLYVACEYGLFRYREIDKRFDYIPLGDFGNVEIAVEDMYFDNENIMWLATEKGVISHNEGSWNVYDSVSTSLPGNNMKSLTLDNDNIAWAGMKEEGVIVRLGNYLGVYTGSTISVLENAGTISSIATGPAETIYFGTENNGLVTVRFFYKDQSFSVIK